MNEPILRKKILFSDKLIIKQKKYLIIAIFSIVTLFIGSSFALLTSFKQSDEIINITTGNLSMTVNDLLVSLNNKLPEPDKNGLSNATARQLILTNNGTIDIDQYEVKLVYDQNQTSTLNYEYIKYAISLDNGQTYLAPKNLAATNNIIYTGYHLEKGTAKTLYLKVWIDENSDNNSLNKVFYGSVDVELYQKSACAPNSKANIKKALQEVADAYYQKGIYGQYDFYRSSLVTPPEEATSQHLIYNVCSSFTYAVYYQAFGIRIPYSTQVMLTYAEQFKDEDDVIEYIDFQINNTSKTIKDKEGNSVNVDFSSATNSFGKALLNELEIGDLVYYHKGGSGAGHTVVVYDFEYNEKDEREDVLFREATWKFDTTISKLTSGLSYESTYSNKYNIYQGTYKERNLQSLFDSVTNLSTLTDQRYFAIIRPLLKDENGEYTGKYYYANYQTKQGTTFGYQVKGDRVLEGYCIGDVTQSRMEHSNIYIEKTVDVFNNSTVYLGDNLTYQIKIKNNSNEAYDSFEVKDNISEYVDVVNAGSGTVENNTITWNVNSLASGQEINLTYQVTVKNNSSLIGKEIISTGTVAGIPSSTVKNKILKSLSNTNKQTISTKLQQIINDNNCSGLCVISKIYNDTLQTTLHSHELDDIENLVIRQGGANYDPINTKTLYLNTNNSFYNMVLPNYYGGLYIYNGTSYMQYWENTSGIFYGRRNINDTIFKENFQTGDILIYKNTQAKAKSYKAESGNYYLIYISPSNKITVNGEDLYGFIGINTDMSLNVIGMNELRDDLTVSVDSNALQTLLAKDFYVIVRPGIKY